MHHETHALFVIDLWWLAVLFLVRKHGLVDQIRHLTHHKRLALFYFLRLRVKEIVRRSHDQRLTALENLTRDVTFVKVPQFACFRIGLVVLRGVHKRWDSGRGGE